jgi:small subunit ribosomal protein S4
VREKSKKQLRITDSVKLAESIGMPAWVQVDATSWKACSRRRPTATNSAPTSRKR